MAIYCANLVMSFIEKGTHGVMAAHRKGECITTVIPYKTYLPAAWTQLTIMPPAIVHASSL